jgi:hypothetical protein
MALFQMEHTPFISMSNILSHFDTSNVYFTSSFCPEFGFKKEHVMGFGVSTHSATHILASSSLPGSSSTQFT